MLNLKYNEITKMLKYWNGNLRLRTKYLKNKDNACKQFLKQKPLLE